jgi:thioredoxin 1
MKFPRLWLLALTIAVVACAAKEPPPYNEKANAHHDIAAAIARAGASKRNVVLVFGANWCIGCRALHWQMQKPELASIIEKYYVVVQVDLGRENKNLDVADQYHVPVKHGLPAVAILDPHGSLLYAMDQGQFSDARRMGFDSFKTFFEKWEPK